MLNTAQPPAGTPRAVEVGETCSRELRWSRQDIAEFARITGDTNPLHLDHQAAERARHGEIIASGQQTMAQLMGLAASHFSRLGDGFQRELLCLNTNFAFKAPVFADQHLVLSWRVAQVEWHPSLQGWLAHVDGRAAVRHAQPAVVARGTFLVKVVVLP